MAEGWWTSLLHLLSSCMIEFSAILFLRTYAIYGATRKVLISLVSVYVVRAYLLSANITIRSNVSQQGIYIPVIIVTRLYLRSVQCMSFLSINMRVLLMLLQLVYLQTHSTRSGAVSQPKGARLFIPTLFCLSS